MISGIGFIYQGIARLDYPDAGLYPYLLSVKLNFHCYYLLLPLELRDFVPFSANSCMVSYGVRYSYAGPREEGR